MMISQEIVYAKSEPRQTIKEHTDALLNNLCLLKKTYGKQIDNLITKEYKDVFWNVLSLVIQYHDLGKINTNFQNKIRQKIGLTSLTTGIEREIPHNFLSPSFFGEEILRYEKDIIKVIIQSIVFHHEYKNLPEFKMIEETIKEDLEERKYLLSPLIKLPSTLWTGYERYYNKRITSEDKNIYLFYLFVKGFLHRLDHASSGFVEVEIKDDSLPGKVIQFLSQKGNLRPLQEYVLGNREKNLVIVASTGIGKTEAGLLWAGRRKTFFTLPIRVAVNSIFSRVYDNTAINYKNAGLMHSTSRDYLNYAGYETPFEIYKNSRQLSCQVNVSTIDQLFTFPFKYGGYEKILSTLLYSKVIIDEIQSYEPRIVAIILKGLQEINRLGGKFLIMTATLPDIYLDYLKKWDIPFEYREFLSEMRRHKIKIEGKRIKTALKKMQTLSLDKKVLVIVNTVNQAKQLFKLLKDNGSFPKMLHSLYILEDRKNLEKEMFDFARNQSHGIWITTQIAEASLDIDFDVLFTELSSLDSFFQRMGRVYRFRPLLSDEPNVYVFIDDCSGIGTIYDEEIFNFSRENISRFDGVLLKEEDKVEMVKNIYNREKLSTTKYFNQFTRALQILESVMDYELSKSDAQHIIRDFYTARVIPREIYDKYFDDITRSVKILLMSSDKRMRIKAEQFINDKSLDIPHYRIKQTGLTHIDKLKNVYISNHKYCPREGLLLDEQLSNYI